MNKTEVDKLREVRQREFDLQEVQDATSWDSAGEVQTGLVTEAQAASTPTTSLAEPVPSSPAAAAPEQAGSRGAVPTDRSHPDRVMKRSHGDHSTSEVVMLMGDSDCVQSVSQCWCGGRQKVVFLAEVSDWDSA